MTTVDVDADLRVYDETLAPTPLVAPDDPDSPVGRSLSVLDGGTHRLLAERATELTALAIKAAVDAVTAALAAGIEVTVDGVATEATLTQKANEVTLQLVLDKLVDIFAAVDGLEVTAGNIEINADTLNLQTDEVEDLLRSVRDRLPAALDPDGGVKVHLQNAVDMTDRAGRLLGVVSVTGGVDVSDRPGRLLGHVDVDSLPLPPDAATETTLANRNWRDLPTLIATVTDAGENLVHTPAAGKRVRLWWVSLQNTRDVEPVVTLHLGDPGPGRRSPYHALGIAHWQRVDGPVDGPVYVELSVAATVPITIHYEEV